MNGMLKGTVRKNASAAGSLPVPMPQRAGLNGKRMAAPLSGPCPLPSPLLAQPRPMQQTQALADRISEFFAPKSKDPSRPLDVIIAGGGVGGLVFAVAALKQGFNVKVLERDLTSIRGEGKYRGPIQVQSNALAALEAIDLDTAERILEAGCITGDRINGLCDGRTGEWYCKFDTFHHAADNGLPVTRVISRMVLQELLAEACVRIGGPSVIENNCVVTRYEEFKDDQGRTRVRAHLDGGRVEEGDVLIAADGIWSKLRKQMIGETPAHYSGYTCYTGISDFLPADIDTIGYRVFLGNGKYFVSSDVGEGKVQWYAFHAEPAEGKDQGPRKERLLDLFSEFTDTCTDLIRATPEADVLRRDIFDRAPIFQWTDGRVALLGDSAHAMQPNLGQGGCMAIEDAHELSLCLVKALQAAGGNADRANIARALKEYQGERHMRASAIHGMARMAAYMASTYKTYLGHNTDFERFRIPHPGRMGGKVAMHFTMPSVLSWVLGGNAAKTDALGQRPSACRLIEKPRSLPADQAGFNRYMEDDYLLVGACHANWVLVHERDVAQLGSSYTAPRGLDLGTCYQRTAPEGTICEVRERLASTHHASSSAQGALFASVVRQNGRLWLRAESEHVTVNGKPLPWSQTALIEPADRVQLGGESYVVKLRHVNLPETPAEFLSQPHHRFLAAPTVPSGEHVKPMPGAQVAAPGVQALRPAAKELTAGRA